MDLIKFLNRRIEKTTKERDNAPNLNLKIIKGSKLTAYKEMLEYATKTKKQEEC